MTTALVRTTVNFHGDELVAAEQDGITFVPLKQICDNLGIGWEEQRQRIQNDDILSEVTQLIHLPNGRGNPNVLAIPVDYIQGWMFGINANQIRFEMRERLLLYKRECYRVLHQAFTGQQQPDRITALEERVAALEGRRRLPPPAVLCQSYSEVLAALQSIGGRGQTQEVAAVLPEMSPNSVKLRLWNMARKGLIRRTYRGIYEVEA